MVKVALTDKTPDLTVATIPTIENLWGTFKFVSAVNG